MDVDHQGVNLELPPLPQTDLTEEEEGGGREEEAEVFEVKLCLEIKWWWGEENTAEQGFPNLLPRQQ